MSITALTGCSFGKHEGNDLHVEETSGGGVSANGREFEMKCNESSFDILDPFLDIEQFQSDAEMRSCFGATQPEYLSVLLESLNRRDTLCIVPFSAGVDGTLIFNNNEGRLSHQCVESSDGFYFTTVFQSFRSEAVFILSPLGLSLLQNYVTGAKVSVLRDPAVLYRIREITLFMVPSFEETFLKFMSAPIPPSQKIDPKDLDQTSGGGFPPH